MEKISESTDLFLVEFLKQLFLEQQQETVENRVGINPFLDQLGGTVGRDRRSIENPRGTRCDGLTKMAKLPRQKTLREPPSLRSHLLIGLCSTLAYCLWKRFGMKKTGSAVFHRTRAKSAERELRFARQLAVYTRIYVKSNGLFYSEKRKQQEGRKETEKKLL